MSRPLVPVQEQKRQRRLVDNPNEVHVLVINTGGTMTMDYQDNVLVPQPNALVKILKKMTMLHDEEYAQNSKLYDYYGSPANTFVLPLSKTNKRIVYTVLEHLPQLDSCNMTTENWSKIVNDIEQNYQQYIGFVILHGTDTMAYTASALSFMCENQGKPIILTTSQIPIHQMRNDAFDNLLGALLLAGSYIIPEVGLYFQGKLFRGNRVKKINAMSLTAFSSPNMKPLVNAELDIFVHWDSVWRPKTTKKFTVQTNMNQNVGLLRLFPGITTATVKAFLQPPMEGIVLETYGMGNAPNNRPDLLDEFKKGIDRGMLIINCSQCLQGSVHQSYATGKALTDLGIIPGHDMTPEAALAKLSYALGKTELTIEEKKRMLYENLRGEMSTTLGSEKISLKDNRFIQAITKFVNVSCKEELENIRDVLTPSLACAAAKAGDINALQEILETGGNLSGEDYDGRTPLHVATHEGHYEVVLYLLKRGATIYTKDQNGNTPLKNAVKRRHTNIIKLLRQTGAHFSKEEIINVGTKLCSLAAYGDMEGLKAWHLAGLDMDQCSYDGQTPLKVALAAGNQEVVEFLQSTLKQNMKV
ncbi:60 kDa lysophospholipase-like [Chiloscyllium plagiosum]|uniref:60 kDa lysophospholipase-like n=1 Tax=Chiloscyllium plagiosum TaxID=36176 RepID=UPI001CB88472|nr:60 kDa lysophospholipase-like [Chiloscyllium plagiosum]